MKPTVYDSQNGTRKRVMIIRDTGPAGATVDEVKPIEEAVQIDDPLSASLVKAEKALVWLCAELKRMFDGTDEKREAMVRRLNDGGIIVGPRGGRFNLTPVCGIYSERVEYEYGYTKTRHDRDNNTSTSHHFYVKNYTYTSIPDSVKKQLQYIEEKKKADDQKAFDLMRNVLNTVMGYKSGF